MLHLCKNIKNITTTIPHFGNKYIIQHLYNQQDNFTKCSESSETLF